MRALVQEACQGPVRDAVAQHAHKLADLSEADLRPLVLRDFQACTRNKVSTPQANSGCASVAEALTNSWICNTSLRFSTKSPPLISISQCCGLLPKSLPSRLSACKHKKNPKGPCMHQLQAYAPCEASCSPSLCRPSWHFDSNCFKIK